MSYQTFEGKRLITVEALPLGQQILCLFFSMGSLALGHHTWSALSVSSSDSQQEI